MSAAQDMSDLPLLGYVPPAKPSSARRPLTDRADLDKKFWDWRERHPEVEGQLVGMARKLKRLGYDKFPFRLLWESLRYRRMARRKKADGEFVCNDHLTARWSRWLMIAYPELAGCFDLRSSPKADAEVAHE